VSDDASEQPGYKAEILLPGDEGDDEAEAALDARQHAKAHHVVEKAIDTERTIDRSSLLILDRLSYIFECFAIDAGGEAKSAIHSLICDVDADRVLGQPRRQHLLSGLRAVEKIVYSSEPRSYQKAAGTLCKISGELWRETLR
jgi:hypothetical protein